MSLLMLMMFTGIAFAAFYVMIQPSVSTAKRQRTQLKGEAIQRGLRAFEAHYGASVPTPDSLDYLVEDVDSDGCTMDDDSASPTFGQLQGWCGPYLDTVWQSEPDDFKLDGWGTPFEVTTGVTTEVRSCGPDKTCGGGSAADDVLFSL